MSYANRKFNWDLNALKRFYNNYVIKWLNAAMSWTAAQKKQARANLGFGNGDIDDEPTAGSDNLVKSGGVQNELALGAVYDVSAKNPTAGSNNDGKWESLSALLSDANLSTLIPTSVRKGGMSIKFVQSSDNKYVQYLYHGTSISVAAFTNTDNWEKTNLEEELNQVRQEIGDFSESVKHARIFNGSWLRESDETAFIIPVKAGDVVRVKQNPDSADCYWGFLSNYSDTDVSPNWATGNSGNGWSFADYTANAPSNAKYLYLCYIINGTDRTPSIATINGISILDENYIKYLKNALSQEVSRAQQAEQLLQSNITAERNRAVTAETDINSRTFIDNEITPNINSYRRNTWISSDGTIGTQWQGTMDAYIFEVSEGQIINLNNLHLYTVPGNTLMYAFYSDKDTLDSTTFISGSQVYIHPLVETVSLEATVPENAKVIVFLNYTNGGNYSVKVTEKEPINEVLEQTENDVAKNENAINNIATNNRNILYVKKNGSGDFTDIQSAINSITDASATNRYEVRVCDDFEYTDLTDLYLLYTPTSKNPNANPTSPIAAIITKPYVDIVGYERRRKVTVHSPYDLAESSFQYVQCMYLQGTCVVDNIDFELKNGRYAIHQESGGSRSSVDYHAKTTLRNCNAIHLGNADSSHGAAGWTSICGEAVGMCDGLELVYENVMFYPAYYAHGNVNFDAPNKLTFKNCSIKYDKASPNVQGCYITSLGSGQAPEITLMGCNFYVMGVQMSIKDENVVSDACHDIRTFIPNVHGNSNYLTVPVRLAFNNNVLMLQSTSNNVNVKVTGGTAKSLIWGEEDLFNYSGTLDAKGFAAGTEFIESGVFRLGKRLGDCTTNNKTLTVAVGENTVTITLSANYTSMTNQQVVDALNAQMTNANFLLSSKDNAFKYLPCKDDSCQGVAHAETIYFGSPVVRDYSNVPFGWKLCPAGTKAQGISCERINKGDYGVIALLDKISLISIRDNNISSKFAKAGSNGYWVTATEQDADIVGIGGGVWIKAN